MNPNDELEAVKSLYAPAPMDDSRRRAFDRALDERLAQPRRPVWLVPAATLAAAAAVSVGLWLGGPAECAGKRSGDLLRLGLRDLLPRRARPVGGAVRSRPPRTDATHRGDLSRRVDPFGTWRVEGISQKEVRDELFQDPVDALRHRIIRIRARRRAPAPRGRRTPWAGTLPRAARRGARDRCSDEGAHRRGQQRLTRSPRSAPRGPRRGPRRHACAARS